MDAATTVAATENDHGSLFELPQGLQERCSRLYGWNSTLVQKVALAYRQFIKLKLQHEDWHAQTLSPSLLVDQMWHQHILQVEHYVSACQKYCDGHLIGHDPDGMLNARAKQKRIQTTQISLQALFGKKNVDESVWNFGEDEGGQETAQQTESQKRKKRKTEETSTEEDEDNHNGSDGDFPKQIITIRVRDQAGEETFFKVKHTTPMAKVFESMANKTGIESSSLLFKLDGERIDGRYTPLDLNWDDQEQMDCLLEQTGC